MIGELAHRQDDLATSQRVYRAIFIATGGDEDLYALMQGHRCFVLAPDSEDLDIHRLMLAMFSPNYMHVDGRPVVITRQPLSPEVLVKLAEQGWPAVEEYDPDRVLLVNSRFDIDAAARNILAGAGDVFIAGDHQLEEPLHHAVCTLLDEQPGLRDALAVNRRLREQGAALRQERDALQQRLHNAETTISVIRTKYKDDYDILFRWYQQEYEALPAWYKKFGSLLKVLTGKRSFQSLIQAIRRRIYRRAGNCTPLQSGNT